MWTKRDNTMLWFMLSTFICSPKYLRQGAKEGKQSNKKNNLKWVQVITSWTVLVFWAVLLRSTKAKANCIKLKGTYADANVTKGMTKNYLVPEMKSHFHCLHILEIAYLDCIDCHCTVTLKMCPVISLEYWLIHPNKTKIKGYIW